VFGGEGGIVAENSLSRGPIASAQNSAQNAKKKTFQPCLALLAWQA